MIEVDREKENMLDICLYKSIPRFLQVAVKFLPPKANEAAEKSTPLYVMIALLVVDVL